MNHLTPFIFGCSGHVLTNEEINFFSKTRPVGLIVFARNCDSKEQLKKLTDQFREVTNNPNALILIDQEGGRVARLKPPVWKESPPAYDYARIAEKDIEAAKKASYENAKIIASQLTECGINVDCAPLIDVPEEGSHDIIGDRAFGRTPEMVIELASEFMRGLQDGNVMPVIKHIPGHGRAKEDSHMTLPIVKAAIEELEAIDFVPFKALKDAPFAMTAHILYLAIDSELPATLSNKVISIIRNNIGFDGILMSDDIDMKALKGNLRDLSEQTLAAGCDLVLHCTGKMEDMLSINPSDFKLSSKTEERYYNLFKNIS